MRVPELPSRKQHGMNKYQLVFDTRIESELKAYRKDVSVGKGDEGVDSMPRSFWTEILHWAAASEKTLHAAAKSSGTSKGRLYHSLYSQGPRSRQSRCRRYAGGHSEMGSRCACHPTSPTSISASSWKLVTVKPGLGGAFGLAASLVAPGRQRPVCVCVCVCVCHAGRHTHSHAHQTYTSNARACTHTHTSKRSRGCGLDMHEPDTIGQVLCISEDSWAIFGPVLSFAPGKQLHVPWPNILM